MHDVSPRAIVPGLGQMVSETETIVSGMKTSVVWKKIHGAGIPA
jgi:hypothetical protein